MENVAVIQLTGRDTYKQFTNYHNKMNPLEMVSFEDSPDLMIENLEYAVESAFFFWCEFKKNLRSVAKEGNVLKVTKMVNGGSNGYADRLHRYNLLTTHLGIAGDKQ